MRALLALAFVLFSALPALACSYVPNANSCPSGQVFDTFSCSCKPLVSDLSHEDAEKIVTDSPAACEAGFAINPETSKCQSIVAPAPAQVAGDLIYKPALDKIACEVDGDCRVIPGICDKPTAVNKENMFDFIAAANKVRMTTPCKEQQDYSKTISGVSCLNKLCVIR